MADPTPDRVPVVVAALMIVVAACIGVYAFFWPSASPPAARAANVDDLERSLATARRTCVDGPPQGPACAEAARLTEEIARSRAAR
jgi:hypothetical protein